MPNITLPVGLSGLEASPKTREKVKNLFYTKGQNPTLSIRPGIDFIKDAFGKCRGIGLFRNNVTGDEELYMVSGTKLVRITVINSLARKELSSADVEITDVATEVITTVTDIPGSGKVILLGGFTKLLVMVQGERAYVYDQVNGLLEITDSNYLPSDSVTYDSGRFVFVPTDGSPFFWSELDDPSSIQPQSFADAEIFPDPNRATFANKSTIYVLGSRSTQRFNYDATQDTYLTYKGEESNIGYVGGMVRFGETFAFVGNGADGDFDIYVMSGQPTAISNDYVSELINNEYSFPDIQNMRAESFKWKGTEMIVFYFPRHTLVYYGGWSFWQSGISGSAIETWRIGFVEYAYGYLWTGDLTDESIGVIRDSGNEYGNDIEWLIKTFISLGPESNAILNRVVATATMGKVSTTEANKPQIGLSANTDGRIFRAPFYLNLGRAGDYNKDLRWGAPIIKGYDFFGLQFVGKGNAVMNVDEVYFE